MNIIKTLITRLVTNRGTNKTFGTKTYSTEAAAEKAAEQLSKEAADFWGLEQNINYLVFFVPQFDRWVVAFNGTEAMQRKDFRGGYIGFLASKGFYTF